MGIVSKILHLKRRKKGVLGIFLFLSALAALIFCEYAFARPLHWT